MYRSKVRPAIKTIERLRGLVNVSPGKISYFKENGPDSIPLLLRNTVTSPTCSSPNNPSNSLQGFDELLDCLETSCVPIDKQNQKIPRK